MYQHWFINCNKCITLMQDVNNRGNWGGMRVWAGVGIWNSV